MLARRVAPVGSDRERKRRESVATLVDERSAQLEEKLEALDVQTFARAHDDAGRKLCAVGVQPARTLDAPLQQRAIKRMLVITRTERGDRLNDFEPSQIGGVAHGRTPVAAPQRYVQQLRLCAQDSHDGIALV